MLRTLSQGRCHLGWSGSPRALPSQPQGSPLTSSDTQRAQLDRVGREAHREEGGDAAGADLQGGSGVT